MKELRLQHARPNLHTVIREGQKWQRNPPEDRITADGIYTVKEIRNDESILLVSDEDGSRIELEEPIEILNTKEWNYWGEG